MSLLSTRSFYKPFDHPWMFDYYVQQNQMHWFPEDVPLHNDVKDWQDLNDLDRNLLTQIFRLFTQSDVDVGSGYVDRYMKIFKKPEARMMMGAFHNMESIHQHAYSLLLDTVGMPEVEYKAFAEYEAMADKHEYIDAVRVTKGDRKSIAKALAIYSAFTEGLQLFSSFIVLLNFPRFGKMKGMGQIITWSIVDETMHAESMIKLFKTYVRENRRLWNDKLKKDIYDIAEKMVDLEEKFIDVCFAMGDMENLTPEQVKKYIRYIADRRLISMGMKGIFKVKRNPLLWVEEMINAPTHTNFFENRATDYARGALKGDWGDVWGVAGV